MVSNDGAYELIIPPSVIDQINNIFKYISANQTKNRAVKVLKSIWLAMDKIKAAPYNYPKEQIFENDAIRRLIVGGTYRIVYEITGSNIIVLAVFHNSRNPDSLN